MIVNLLLKGYDALPENIAYELNQIKVKHLEEFNIWCRNHDIDDSDISDSDFKLLGKQIIFLKEKGYNI